MGSDIASDVPFEQQRAEWLEKRRFTVGGSEAATVLGRQLDYQASAYQLWAEKTGQFARKNAGEQAEWGNRLESTIAEQYGVRTGRPLQDLGMFTILKNPRYPFAHATLDRKILAAGPAPGHGALEVKNVSFRVMQGHWSQGAPDCYWIQLQHQLMVAELNWGAITALFDGNTLYVGDDTLINPAFISELAEAEEKFIDCVRRGIPPKPIDGSLATRRTLDDLFPKPVSKKRVILPPASAQWDAELVDVKKTLRALTQQKRSLENCLREAIGDAEVGKIPNRDVEYTLKQVTKKEHIVKECQYRDLRRKVSKTKKGGQS